MWEMFSVHDDDHCGFLGQFEVRRLLKYMGDLVAQRQRLLRLSKGRISDFFDSRPGAIQTKRGCHDSRQRSGAAQSQGVPMGSGS